CLLQHGSLLLDFDASLHQRIFPAWPLENPTAGVISLRTLLRNPPPIADLVSALREGWCETLGGRCVVGGLLPVERDAVEKGGCERYAGDAWTFQR
ncbi:MAG TPA: hypothetical protein VEH53_05905, partial [archaeon]|nr:hypothetical protein [archaeon]